ncbi:MAG: hypothetical protein ACLGI8_01555 [Acidimicrobiia bacterium]
MTSAPEEHRSRSSTGRRGARSIAVALAAALTTAACGDDPAAPATSSTAATERTTTTAEPATSSTAGPTTSAAPPCPTQVAVPEGAAALTEAPGEIDGDGADDSLRTFLVDETWILQVELAAGGGAQLELGASSQGGMGLVGGADVDGDDRAEVWVRVGSGASTVILGVVRFDDCTLERVTLESGQALELPAGGSVGATAGVECRADQVDADLTTFAAFYREGSGYEVTATQWSLEGRVLVERSSSTSEVQADDPDFVRATTFTCHDLTL